MGPTHLFVVLCYSILCEQGQLQLAGVRTKDTGQAWQTVWHASAWNKPKAGVKLLKEHSGTVKKRAAGSRHELSQQRQDQVVCQIDTNNVMLLVRRASLLSGDLAKRSLYCWCVIHSTETWCCRGT